jgi:FkbM family methyltransferase
MTLSSSLREFIAGSPIANFPVSIKQGPAQGARWTLFPFSMYWRLGGDNEVAVAAAKLPALSGGVFWDFGAHFGIHTVAMARQVGAAGEVAAFEPDPYSFAKLSRHVRMNELDNVRLFCAAVSSGCGAKEMADYGRGSPTQHFCYPDNNEVDWTERPSFIVQTVTADELVAGRQIRLPDLIKVDVEGHGGFALAGAARSITERLPMIVMSSHSSMETEGVRQILEPLDYRVYSFDGMALSWEELTFHTRILVKG